MKEQKARLEGYLDDLQLKAPIEWMFIPPGFSEDELMEIFQLVTSLVEDRDSIYFDITHGFRSLPMTIMATLPFLRVVKEVSVESIYYGVLTSTATTGTSEVPIIPIIDLGVFSRLVDWSFAASHMIKAGNGYYARRIVKEEQKPLVSGPGVADQKTKVARSVDKLSRLLGTYTDHVQVSHGVGLPKLASDLLATLAQTREDIAPGPFRALIGRIEADLAPLDPSDSDLAYFYIAQWCHRHGLVQQSATILQEGLLCFLMFKLGFSAQDSFKRENREEIQKALNAYCYDDQREGTGTWPILRQRTKEEISKVFGEYAGLIKHWLPLADIRNTLNHAGMSPSAMEPEKLKRKFQELLDAVMTIVDGGGIATADS